MDEMSNVQNTDLQDTIPDDSQEPITDVEDAGDFADTPDSETSAGENVVRDTENAAAQNSVSEPFISVQYNHKSRDFTKDEAVKFIQKGMHTENLRTKLDYAAALQGVDVNTLVDRIVTAPEKNYRAYLENLYGKGSDNVEIGMRIYREKQSDTYKKIVAERENSIEMKNQEIKRQSVNSRLADEYIMLKSQMPDAPEYGALPDSVIIEAADGKRDLYSAYLCYLHKEKIKIDAAKKTEVSAANASTGAMKSNSGDNVSSIEKNFLSGLWTK